MVDKIPNKYDPWMYEMNTEDTLELLDVLTEDTDSRFTLQELADSVDPRNTNQLVTVVVDLHQMKLLEKHGQEYTATTQLASSLDDFSEDIQAVSEYL